MTLYVFRHGIAEDSNPEGDSQRRLTKKGKDKTAEVVQRLRGKLDPEVILTSPYVRARETAEIAAGNLKLKESVEPSDALYPGSSVEETLVELVSRKEERLMVVGHNPHLENLVSALIGRSFAGVELKKAAVACIELGPTPRMGEGVLKWLSTPSLLGV
jgi:phosphohistidine phosphatase